MVLGRQLDFSRCPRIFYLSFPGGRNNTNPESSCPFKLFRIDFKRCPQPPILVCRTKEQISSEPID